MSEATRLIFLSHEYLVHCLKFIFLSLQVSSYFHLWLKILVFCFCYFIPIFATISLSFTSVFHFPWKCPHASPSFSHFLWSLLPSIFKPTPFWAYYHQNNPWLFMFVRFYPPFRFHWILFGKLFLIPYFQLGLQSEKKHQWEEAIHYLLQYFQANFIHQFECLFQTFTLDIVHPILLDLSAGIFIFNTFPPAIKASTRVPYSFLKEFQFFSCLVLFFSSICWFLTPSPSRLLPTSQLFLRTPLLIWYIEEIPESRIQTAFLLF